jgi:virginiamycin B lyase
MHDVSLPPGSAPYALVRAPDGALWMTLLTPPALARFDPGAPDAGVTVHELDGPGPPMQMTIGADSVLWYTRGDDRLGRLTGADIELPPGSTPYGIGAAADGTIWFTAPGLNQVGRRSPDGEIRMIDLPIPGAYPAMLAVAEDGGVWVALNAAGKLGRLTGDDVQIIDLPDGSAPVGIAAAGTGVWYADIAGGRAGHVDAGGTVDQVVAFADDACRPHAVATDPDGGCWVTLWASGHLARVTEDSTVTEFALPGREPHGLVLTGRHVWVAMESGTLVAHRTGLNQT